MGREKAVLALLLAASMAVTSLMVLGTASAGSLADPDMEDSAQDSVSGREARDLISGWVGNETETNIELDLKLSALEPFTPYADWQTLPVVYYEFFFDVVTPQGTESYEARATVPMHGPFAALTQFELFLITYGVGGTIANETLQPGAPAGRYIVNDAIVSFSVDKVDIGAPARGDVLEGIWARVRSATQRNTGDSITEDTMQSHLTPGKSYTFSGGITFYAITLTAAVTSANGSADDPAHFTLTIHSDSEKVANVSLRNTSTMPANWTITTDRQLYIIEPGADATAVVTLTPGGNATNITRRVTVGATFKDDQGGNRSSDNAIVFSVFVPPPPKQGGPDCVGANCPATGGGDFMAYVPAIAGGVVALGAVIVIFGVVLPGRNRAKAQAAYTRIAQMKLAKQPRSGAIPGRPGAPMRPGAPGMPPRPGAPGMPARPGAPPQGARPRPIPRRR